MEINKFNNDYVEIKKNVKFGFERIKLNYYEVQEILKYMEKNNMV